MEHGSDDYSATMRARYSAAIEGWSTIRQDFRDDLKYRSGDPGDQWDSNVKSSRDDDGIPALTMDRLNPLVNQIVNQARKDRPQPKVNPGEGGDPAIADAIEGKFRHCLYESHAEVAFDCSQAYTAAGGFGFVKWEKAWVKNDFNPTLKRFSPAFFIQEPRLKRIPDPLTVLFDPDVEEIDYSDARYCFKEKKYDRDDYKAEFKREPIPFPFDDDRNQEWGDERKVVVAEYWWVENKRHRLIQLADGRIDLSTEIGEYEESDIVNEREIMERVLHMDICDGAGAIEENIWEGHWIPYVPQIAQEVISGGKRRYISAIRYSRDPQQFINAMMSGTAERAAQINAAPFMGYKGQFKDGKWRDGKRHFYLEAEPVTINGAAAPLPTRNAFEPAIQGYTSATAQGIDALKGAIGYVDSVTRPSQADISGVAVERRDQQANLANMQYEDSLTQTMWHVGRVGVDLLLALADTPRVWDHRTESGETKKIPVTTGVDEGVNPDAPGYEGYPHLNIADGDYGVTINEGPTFATKQEEGTEFLMNLIKEDPALIPIYLPAICKRLGYEDLEEIATAAQPPAIKQAIAAAQGKAGDPAMLAQQAQALQAQNQQLQQILQQVSMILKTKQIETQGRLQVQQAKTQGDLEKGRLELIADLIKTSTQHAHEATIHQSDKHHDAAAHMLDMFHEAQLPHQAAALAPSPAPAGPTQ